MTLPGTLFARLTRLRRRIRRLVWTHGLSRVFAIVVGLLLVAGLADWALHLDDPGVRLTFLIGIIGAAVWGVQRFLVVGLSQPASNLDVAQRIEHRFPDFADSLASTVQFLEEGTDARLGSPELQKRVIEETVERFERIDLSKVVNAAPARRAAATALVVCVVAILLTVAHPPSAGLALKRLLLPFSAEAWPRRTNLRLLTEQFAPVEFPTDEPFRVVRGRPVEYFVDDADGRLPKDVRLVLQIGNEEPVWETLRQTTLRDEQGATHEVYAVKIPTAEGSLRFRVVGGDDDSMPFHNIEIVPSPVIVDLQVTLAPPNYTGISVTNLSPGVGHIQALVGTRVNIAVRVDVPVSEAMLHLHEKDVVPLKLDAAGTGFQASFVVESAGAFPYGFDFVDRYGFTHKDVRYELRGIADLVPQVSIEEPPSDINVTVDAEVPLRVTAKDDISLRDVRLRYQLGESTDAVSEAISLAMPSGSAGPVTVEHLWKLADLRLREGMRVVYHAEATDDLQSTSNDPNAGIGRSPSRSLLVVSREEKSNEIAARQLALLEQMEKVRQTQQQARDEVNVLQLQWSKAGRLQASDLDMLKRIELDQRRIAENLHDPRVGISSTATDLRNELRRNNVENADTAGRLDRMVRELFELQQSHSTAINQQLIEALKEAENSPSSPNDAERTPNTARRGIASLESARNGQTSIVETLESMLQDLGRWRDRRELTAELDEMIARQKKLNTETADTSRKTLTKGVPELSPQEQADLARLGERQTQQAERLKNFEKELQQAAEKLSEPQKEENRLQEMRNFLQRQATGGKMQDASRSLRENQIGQAMIDQQQVLETLQEADRLMKTRDDLSPQARLERIHAAEQDLEALRNKEAQLQSRADKAAASRPTPDSPTAEKHKAELENLRKEQSETRAHADETARQLKRLQIQRAEQTLHRAATRMQQVEQNFGENSSEQAAQNAKEALEDVEQAQRETARARRELEDQLAREALEKIADALQTMIPRQQSVIDETTRLEAERVRRGNWSRGQLKSLANLAEVQRGLKTETEVLAAKIPDAAVFELALRQAADEMDRAAARLSRRLTDEQTLDPERRARKRFADLVAALTQDQKAQADQQHPEQRDQPEQPDREGAPGELIALVAQLKLLKTMQEDLRERTTGFDRIREGNQSLDKEQQQELARLSEEQGRLAELAADLARTILGAHSQKPEGDELKIPHGTESELKKAP